MSEERSGLPADTDSGLHRGLGRFDATMLVMGSMIGSGIFLSSSFMARQVGSPGWLLVAWTMSGVLTLCASLSLAELGAMMPRAGGPYVYLREAFSPLWGFLYGWTWSLIVQTGSIAALGIAFARFLGVLLPGITEERYLVSPIHLGEHYAVSISTAQATALALILVLTWINARGLVYGKRVQNVFTISNTTALVAVILAGLALGSYGGVNFGDLWTVRNVEPIVPGVSALTAFGLVVALAISQGGSYFSMTGWENISYTAGEVSSPARNVPFALAAGTIAVVVLYLLTNIAYLMLLPFEAVQSASADRIGSVALESAFPGRGAVLMAGLIVIATFGCTNAQILSGARIPFAMARDRTFFRGFGQLNRARVPGRALALQGLWAGLLVLPRTVDPATGEFGNVYADLLNYTIFAAFLAHAGSIMCVFRLRAKWPDAERPYRAVGYPVVPAIFLVGAVTLMLAFLVYQPYTSWPGLLLALAGVPVYAAFRRRYRDAPVIP